MRRGIGRLRAGGSGFSPASLFAAGEQGAWYDPSDFSTMWQDSAGTTPVTALGQPVGKILDKSPRGNHATQATTPSRPLILQDASGFFYLGPDGVDDILTSPSFSMPATATMAAAVLFTNGAGAVGNVFDGVTNRMLMGASSSNDYRAYNGGATAGGTRNAANHVMLANFAGVAGSLEVDKVTVAASDTGSLGLSGGMTVLGGTGQFMSGRFYGGVVLSRALTVAEKASLYTYLGAKAGLAL